jgi:hypothetical protein
MNPFLQHSLTNLMDAMAEAVRPQRPPPSPPPPRRKKTSVSDGPSLFNVVLIIIMCLVLVVAIIMHNPAPGELYHPGDGCTRLSIADKMYKCECAVGLGGNACTTRLSKAPT